MWCNLGLILDAVFLLVCHGTPSGAFPVPSQLGSYLDIHENKEALSNEDFNLYALLGTILAQANNIAGGWVV